MLIIKFVRIIAPIDLGFPADEAAPPSTVGVFKYSCSKFNVFCNVALTANCPEGFGSITLSSLKALLSPISTGSSTEILTADAFGHGPPPTQPNFVSRVLPIKKLGFKVCVSIIGSNSS